MKKKTKIDLLYFYYLFYILDKLSGKRRKAKRPSREI